MAKFTIDQNKAHVERLQSAGDRLESPREITHFMFFRDAASHAECRDGLLKIGFVVKHDSTKQPGFDEENDGYSLTFSRVEKATLEHINHLTRELQFLAEEFEAEYDGWDADAARE